MVVSTIIITEEQMVLVLVFHLNCLLLIYVTYTECNYPFVRKTKNSMAWFRINFPSTFCQNLNRINRLAQETARIYLNLPLQVAQLF